MFSRLLFLGFAMLLSWSVQAQFPCFPGQVGLAHGFETSFCDDGSGPALIRFKGKPAGLPHAFVVVDADDIIVHIGYSNTIDFSGLGDGLRVYSFSLIGSITADVGDILSETELASGCYSLSTNFIEIDSNGGQDGGTLAGGPFSFCVGDGVADMIPEDGITVSGSSGSNFAWIVTDDQGNILGLPPTFSAVDFDGAGAGACLVWYLRYEDGLTGLAADLNIDNLEGCFDLSNSITVNRSQPEGGTLEGGPFSFCVGDGVADMIPEDGITVSGSSGSNFAWIVTDDQGNILGLPPTFSAVDFDGAGAGACLVWYLRYEDGLTGLAADLNIDNLEGCFDLSNAITVNRSQPEGGTLAGGPFSFCVGDGVADMIPEDAITVSGSSGSNFAWIVTDDQGNILGLPPTFSAVDFDGAGAGACLVWYLRYEDGLTGLEADLNIDNLEGCFDLSNAITVNRSQPEGGNIYTETGNVFNRVVIANRASGTISAVNSDDNQLLGTFAMPDDGEPMYVVFNSTNNTVLVGDYNGQVVAFDALDYSVVGQAAAGNGVFHMWISPDNQQLWVNNELDRTISVINPTTMEAINTVMLPTDLFDAGYKPHDVILMPNNAAAFVTLLGPGDEDYVIKYDTGTFLETARVAVGTDPHVSLTSANDKLYVASQGADELKVLNRSDLSEVATVMVPNAHGLGMNADGTYLYIGNISEGDTNATYTLDLATNTLSGDPVDAPFAAPHNYAVTSDNAQLFITHSGAANNQVSVYSLSPTPSLITTITVGNNPFGLAAYSAAETTTEVSICAGDGISDAFDVTLQGASGANSQWVITDSDLNILGLPMAPPFDLDDAGAGTCLIWHLSFEDGLTGTEVGLNAGDLQGCFNLSNPITVNRAQPEGGTLEGGPFSFCAGDGVADMIPEDGITVSGSSGSNFAWIVTDDQGNILGLPPTFSAVDFDGAGAGTCLVWYLRYEDGLTGLEAELNIDNLEGCYDLSNAITVNRTQPEGGTLEGGPFSFCVDDGVADMIPEDGITVSGSSSSNFAWIVTDDQGNILGLPPTFSAVNFDGAGTGACLVWYLRYEDGLSGLEAELNIDNLEGCYGLSNPITVERTAVNGGMVSTIDGENNVTVTVGDGIADVIQFTNTASVGENFTYIVTDENNMILAIPSGNTADFEDAPAGVCRVWGVAYSGNLLAVAGDNIMTVTLSDACANVSDIFVTINRTEGFSPNVPQNSITTAVLDIQLFPNPATDQLQVEMIARDDTNENITLSVINLNGQVLYQQIIGSAQNRTTVDVANLPAGTYFLRSNDGTQVITKRFIKA